MKTWITRREEIRWSDEYPKHEVRRVLPLDTYTIPDQPLERVPEIFTPGTLIKGDKVHALPYESMRQQDTLPIAWRHATRKSKQRATITGHVSEDRFYTFELVSEFTPPKPEIFRLSLEDAKFLSEMADTKALANAAKAMVNLPMIMKERRETLQMIGNKVVGIAKIASDTQRTSIKRYLQTAKHRKVKVARDIANEHLQLVFGMLPLISEIEGAVDLLQQEVVDWIKVRGTHKIVIADDAYTRSASNQVFSTWAGRLGTKYMQGRVSKTASARTALRYKVTSHATSTARMVGADPLGFAFDAVPLSFITGWISNFDKWIRTLTPLVGLEYETGSRNTRLTVDNTGIIWFNMSPEAEFDVDNDRTPANFRRAIITDKRVVISVEPKSTLHFDLDVGLFEMAASVSLAIQRHLKVLRPLVKAKVFRYRGIRPKTLKPIRYSSR